MAPGRDLGGCGALIKWDITRSSYLCLFPRSSTLSSSSSISSSLLPMAASISLRAAHMEVALLHGEDPALRVRQEEGPEADVLILLVHAVLPSHVPHNVGGQPRATIEAASRRLEA